MKDTGATKYLRWLNFQPSRIALPQKRIMILFKKEEVKQHTCSIFTCGSVSQPHSAAISNHL